MKKIDRMREKVTILPTSVYLSKMHDAGWSLVALEWEREVEVSGLPEEPPVPEATEEIPFGLPEKKHVHYRLMYDLMALAFQGDLTRSATFMLGKDLTGASFPESGFNGGWHGSSHHGDKPDNVANYAKMNRYHVQNLAYFADKLSKTPDGAKRRRRS